MLGSRERQSNEQRFWPKVQKGDKCWEWTGALMGGGRYTKGGTYGAFSDNSGLRHRMIGAHRMAWIFAHGAIPEGSFVLHHCDNPRCVKTDGDEDWPDGHLFLGTQLDNMHDAQRKLRMRRAPVAQVYTDRPGPKSRLTEANVLDIRQRVARGEFRSSLAREFGVTPGYVSEIIAGRALRHLGRGPVRAYQCPGCWSVGLWPAHPDGLECECGQRLTRIDLRED